MIFRSCRRRGLAKLKPRAHNIFSHCGCITTSHSMLHVSCGGLFTITPTLICRKPINIFWSSCFTLASRAHFRRDAAWPSQPSSRREKVAETLVCEGADRGEEKSMWRSNRSHWTNIITSNTMACITEDGSVLYPARNSIFNLQSSAITCIYYTLGKTKP